jgi:AcrR family transcriptional regulator
LVQAAVAALREVGFAGASAREIARRAGCHQSQVFYHFGSVIGLLLAALDDVSDRRLTAYRSILEDANSPADLLDGAGKVIRRDLETGDLAVLTAMIAGAQTVPGLAAEVAARLRPWQEFAEEAVRICVRDLPLGALAPTADLAYAVVAGVLGLELLADLSGDRTRVDNLVTWGKLAASLAGLVAPSMGGPSSRPGSGRGEEASP